MVHRRRITSLALSTLAVVGGFATALPATASAAVAVAQTQQLNQSGIIFNPVVDSTSGLLTGQLYLATSDTVGTSATYTVDWGDGTAKFTQTGIAEPTSQAPLNLSHQYTAHQIYTVTVTVDEGNGSAPVSRTFVVPYQYAAAPTDPTVAVDKTGGNAPFTVIASISGGTVDPAATKTYEVDFGDGSPVQTVQAPASGAVTLPHTYSAPGQYRITAVTTDGISFSPSNGTVNSQIVTAYGLTVSAKAVPGGGVVNIYASGWGAPLADSHYYAYYINWGDGGPANPNGYQLPDGVSHVYAKAGTYTISVKMADVTDPNNTSLPQYTATTTVTVSSVPGQTHPGGVLVSRHGGIDRYQTSVDVADQWAPGSANAVVIARGDQAPDALSGVPFAAHVKGPLLLTDSATMPTEVRAAIDRVTGGPATKKTIYILGGVNAVSQQEQDSLSSAGYTVVRLGGATRYETALKIAGQFGPTQHVIVATGLLFPDALAAGPLGAAENAPIVLTAGTGVDPETAAFIRQHADVDPVGGLAQTAVAGLNTTGQTVNHYLAGADRYTTAIAVALQYSRVVGHTPTEVGVASGLVFPDALSGGAWLAKIGAPLVLTDPKTMTVSTERYLAGLKQANSLQTVDIFGGDQAVSSGIQTVIENL